MHTLYCNLGGSRHDTLHISDLRTVGHANHEARTVEDIRRIISETGASAVMFGFSALPHRAVPTSHAKLDGYLKRVVGYLHERQPKRTQPPVRTDSPVVDMSDFIDQ